MSRIPQPESGPPSLRRRTDWWSWLTGLLVAWVLATLLIVPQVLSESGPVRIAALVIWVLVAFSAGRIVRLIRPSTDRVAYLTGLAVGVVALLILWIVLTSFSAPGPV